MNVAEEPVITDLALTDLSNGSHVIDNDVTTTLADMFHGLKEFSGSYSFIHGYVAAVVCVWGTAANTANIIVLTRPKMTSSTNLILTWLAVADLLTMISCLPVIINFYVMRDDRLPFPSTHYKSWIVYFIFNINFAVACHTVAIWLTIALALFRYVCICYPAQGSAFCSRDKAKTAIFAVYASTAVVCIPNYMAAVIAEKENNITVALTDELDSNWTTSMIESVSFYTVEDTSNASLVEINYWIQAFLIKLIPCFLLTILTILLVIAMHEANVRRMKLKSQGRQDESDRARETNRTTAMLLAVVGLFLLTELPQGVLTLCSIFIAEFYGNVYGPLGDLLDIMALLNNSINFVLYCSMSRQFRETFIEVFCACCPKSPPGWMRLEGIARLTAGSGQTTSTSPAL